eukprot:TRINITY_DN32464_c0_g1_i1.p1 TRINITY_DN32464_c0_g1~~TRINITY_DN32464_c0_g1_i1.p1  ORF type:complete len:319 (-),score=48.76 TRINITY_DN32464_c0_g1_i1:175-1131(-)
MGALVKSGLHTWKPSMSLGGSREAAQEKNITCLLPDSRISTPSLLLRGGSKVRHHCRRERSCKSTVSMQLGEEPRERDSSGSGKVATGVEDVVAEGQASGLKTSDMIRLMKRQMANATAVEDYGEAARIRDIILSLEEKDPVMQLRRQLALAIAEEKYEAAAQFLQELKLIEPKEPEPTAGPKGGVKCCSDTLTKGVRVQVRSLYVKDRSSPSRQQFFFAYRIRITNEGSQSVQLCNRHWVITDANGRVEEVRGPGVIGEQPVLQPGGSFEYTSACPLRTAYGTMEGEYEMLLCDDPNRVPFHVRVGTFALNVNDDDK